MHRGACPFLITAMGLAIGGSNAARAESLQKELVEGTVQVDGTTRYFLKYVPPSSRRGSPLVILLHGGTQSMREIFHPNQTGTARWLSLAKRDGFVLAAPNGTHSITGAAAGDNQRWNDLRSDGGARDSKADDVSFILSMIDDLVKTNDINPRRVYVTGASNGGRMTFRLLVEQPLRFAAGASFIANLPAGEVALPKVGTPIFICNGTEDPLVPDAGGRGEARSTEATVQYWVKANGGSVSTKSSRELPDADPRDGSRIREWSYGGSAGSMPVLYARVEGGGHYMPSSSAGENRPIVKKRFGHHQNRDADGADLAWDFMRVFQR